jgi:hypothetical protein
VTESADGSMLVIQLPRVHVSGKAQINGEIVLDRLPLRAQLITEDGAARLEAYVTGLAGSPKIATRFGEVPARQTGLCLNISPSGNMVVSRVQPPPPTPRLPTTRPATKPASKVPRKKAVAGKPQSQPLTRAQHLRRALPKALDPLVRRVARNPHARWIYRKAAGL